MTTFSNNVIAQQPKGGGTEVNPPNTEMHIVFHNSNISTEQNDLRLEIPPIRTESVHNNSIMKAAVIANHPSWVNCKFSYTKDSHSDHANERKETETHHGPEYGRTTFYLCQLLPNSTNSQLVKKLNPNKEVTKPVLLASFSFFIKCYYLFLFIFFFISYY